MVRVVVEVMPKPEILDPQGQAIARALPGLGFAGVRAVRQGKRFEVDLDVDVDVDGDVDGVDPDPQGSAQPPRPHPEREEALRQAAALADRLLANPVIEDFRVRLED